MSSFSGITFALFCHFGADAADFGADADVVIGDVVEINEEHDAAYSVGQVVKCRECRKGMFTKERVCTISLYSQMDGHKMHTTSVEEKFLNVLERRLGVLGDKFLNVLNGDHHLDMYSQPHYDNLGIKNATQQHLVEDKNGRIEFKGTVEPNASLSRFCQTDAKTNKTKSAANTEKP